MKFAIIIDDDPRSSKELEQALIDLKKDVQIEKFQDIREFVGWIRPKIQKMREDKLKASEADGEKKPKEKAEPDRILLLVIGIDRMGSRFVRLINKARQFLINNNFADEETPPNFILTAYEHENLKVKACRNQYVNNIIFKPFDKPVLNQNLNLALTPGPPPSSSELYVQQAEATIEMLKDVQMEFLSEYGFTSRSDVEIKPGQIAKYHGPLFNAGNRIGMYARCFRTFKHTKYPNEYLSEFTFAGATTAQLSTIRKLLKAANKRDLIFPYSKKGGAATNTSDVNVLIVNPQTAEADDLKQLIERNLKNIKVSHYQDYTSFLIDLDPMLDPQNQGKNSGPKLYNTKISLTLNKKTLQLIKLDPQPEKEQFFLGYTAAELQKENIFKNMINSQSLPEFQQALKNNEPQVIKIISKNKESTYAEITQKAHNSPTEQLLEIRELTPEERARYLQKNRKFKGTVDAIFIDEAFLNENIPERISKIMETLKNGNLLAPTGYTPIFITANDLKGTGSNSYLYPEIFDVFYRPFDRASISAKLALAMPQLDSNELLKMISMKRHQIEIKVSKEVKIESISEANLVMQYSRKIPVGEFRAFYMPMQQKKDDNTTGVQIEEILARCHFTAEPESKDAGNKLYFVFFGMNDHYLKHIRKWILDYYVTKKSKSA